MNWTLVSDDELVFLIRCKEGHAFDCLWARMQPKQDRMIVNLLKENRYCGLEHGDLKIVAMNALFSSIDSYDPKRTLFDAYYHFILERELVNEMKRFNSGSHTLINTALSFDEEIEEGTSLYEVIGYTDERIKHGEDLGLEHLLHHPELKLNAQQKSLIRYRALGFSYEEIGQFMNLTYRQVSRMMVALMKRHQKLKRVL
jgi:DNA-directed RNA polymerase specialized sigma24 family protein